MFCYTLFCTRLVHIIQVGLITHYCMHVYFVTALTAPVVAISITGSTTAGETLTLTCKVTVMEGLTVQPDIEWVDSGGSAITSGVNDVAVGSVMRSGVESTLDLEFSPLHTSHGGQYTCRAIISIGVSGLSGSSSEDIIIQSNYNIQMHVQAGFHTEGGNLGSSPPPEIWK